MKIALVTRGFSTSWGGQEMVAVNLANALIKAGNKVDVYADRIEEPVRSPLPPPFEKGGLGGIKVTKVPAMKILPGLRHFFFNRNIKKLLSKTQYNAIFALCPIFPLDVYRASGGVHAHWMTLKYPNPILRTIKYIASPVNLVMRHLEKNLMNPENHRFIITNSKLVKGHIIKYFAIKEDNIKVVYNGVDNGIFNPTVKRYRGDLRKELGIEENQTVALFAANNWERKGLDTIITAMADTDVTVVVAGRGIKNKFLKMGRKMGVEKKCLIFAGVTKNIERFYGMADFFVLPTQYDPCSNACLEALSCGLPVITTKDNGASEFIEHGKNGFILDRWDDHESLRGFFIKLKDKTMREKMAKAAHEAMNGFTWDKTMEETLKVLEEAVKAP